MSSGFKNVALDFFHGGSIIFDPKTQSLKTETMPLDGKIKEVALDIFFSASISLGNLSNTPLMTRFIKDLSKEVNLLDLTDIKDQELLYQTNLLVQSLIKMPEYGELKTDLERLDHKSSYLNYASMWHSLEGKKASELGLIPHFLRLYKESMDGSDAHKILDEIQKIPVEHRDIIINAALKLVTSKMKGDDVYKILQALQDKDIVPIADEVSEMLSHMPFDVVDGEICAMAILAFKDPLEMVLARFVSSFIKPDSSLDDKTTLIYAFPWAEKKHMGQDVIRLINTFVPKESDIKEVSQFFESIKDIESVEQIDELITLSSELIPHETNLSTKCAILNILIQVPDLEIAKKAVASLKKFPLSTMTPEQIKGIVEGINVVYTHDNLESYLENFIPYASIFSGVEFKHLMINLQDPEIASKVAKICEAGQILIDANCPPYNIFATLTYLKNLPEDTPFESVLSAFARFSVPQDLHIFLEGLLFALANNYSDFNLQVLMNFIVQLPIDGMRAEQLTEIVNAVKDTKITVNLGNFIEAAKKLINKDMPALEIKAVLTMLKSPINLYRITDVMAQTERLKTPDMNGYHIAAILNSLSLVPLDADFSVYVDRVLAFSSPTMNGKHYAPLLKFFIQTPDDKLPLIIKKLEKIKSWHLSDDEFIKTLVLIPSKESISKMALFASGSSAILKANRNVDVGGLDLAQPLSILNDVLESVCVDLSDKLQEKLSPEQSKIKGKLLDCSRLLNEGTTHAVKVLQAKSEYDPASSIRKLALSVSGKVAALAPGNTFFLPYTLSEISASGHAVSLEITKQDDGKYSLTVYNTGFGLNHHQRIGSTSKYYPVVVKDVDLADLNTSFFEDLVSQEVIMSSKSLADQFNQFYTKIKALGTQADDTGRPYNEQGQIGSCTFKSVSKMIHARLGEDYEFIKVLMHKKILEELKDMTGVSLKEFDIKNTPSFLNLKLTLEMVYGSNPSTIDGLVSDDKVVRNASLHSLMSLALSVPNREAVLKIFHSAIAISKAKQLEATKEIIAQSAGTDHSLQAVTLDPVEEALKLQALILISPKPNEEPTESFMFCLAEFLEDEISKTQRKVDPSRFLF